MKSETKEWTVRMLADLRDRINPDAEYQRGSVWSVAQKRLLIDSILTGYDLPKLYFRKLPEGGERLYDVIDGKQRLAAIWEFMSDSFRLSGSFESTELGAIEGKSWSELPPAARDRLQFARVSVSEIQSASEDEVAELFLRLQKGEPLKAAEKRNAIRGPVRGVVADRLARHRVFPLLGVKDKRQAWQEFAAIALLLAVENGPCSLKGADLNDLYTDQLFDPTGPSAETALTLLEDLAKVAESGPGVIRTRWGFVDLYLSLMRFRTNEQTIEPALVLKAFEKFEEERIDGGAKISEARSSFSNPDLADDPADLEDGLKVRADMLAYIQAFARDGATRENVTVRSEVLFKRLQTALAS